MKLESFKDKKATRKMIIISLGIITIVGISLLLYKTFVSSKNANIDNNVLFGFYNGEEKLTEMPQKDNLDNLVFEKAECDNGASVEWDNEKWAPLVKNLTTTKTRCTLYFTKGKPKAQFPGKAIPLAEEGKDGLYAVEHNNLTELDNSWNKTEYRYAGVDPDNYVEFNNEKWRIIGLVNVKVPTEDGSTKVEQRVKIIRTDGIEGQTDFGNYAWNNQLVNDWTKATLKDMLNGIYYNSESGECYTGSNDSWSSQNECDFSTGKNLPKGLDDTARQMIDSEVIWNLGGTGDYDTASNGLVKHWYEYERETMTYNDNPAEWTKENDGEYHKGIGLMYTSDYGYATNGGGIGRESCFSKELYNWSKGEYKSECANNDWLKPSSGYNWLLLPRSSDSDFAFYVHSAGIVNNSGLVSCANGVAPVGYLLPSVTIYDGDGSIENPFKLKVG